MRGQQCYAMRVAVEETVKLSTRVVRSSSAAAKKQWRYPHTERITLASHRDSTRSSRSLTRPAIEAEQCSTVHSEI
eukprot:scaffold232801_cov43-Tisochrysis_lutea.AAC.1